MANGSWSFSSCRPDVQWYGVPGSGCWYYCPRFGQFWVSGGIHVKYGQVLYECGMLGAPCKNYITSVGEFGGVPGQWFEGGAIILQNGVWVVKVGNWGQTGGRLMDNETDVDNRDGIVHVEGGPLPEPERPALPA